MTDNPTFRLGQRVRKKSGSSWHGRIVGTYQTVLTQDGYCVESEREPCSVQIYPASALMAVDEGDAIPLEIARLKDAAIIPTRATPDAAGLDLFATETVTLEPGQRRLIGTGIAIALQPWHVGLVCPRSGMALRDGITVLNAPGAIDPDYRGEVGVILINQGDEPYVVKAGARIAQLVIVPFCSPSIVEVDALSSTQRGAGGFGSTG